MLLEPLVVGQGQVVAEPGQIDPLRVLIAPRGVVSPHGLPSFAMTQSTSFW